MGKRAFMLGLVLVLAGCAGSPGGEQPNLVVVVVVDQLTPGLLDRYDAVFDGGFRRLIDGGRVFSDALQDHSGTYTAAGHASLATGVHPARSGIVGNSWREYRDGAWRSVYSAEDPDVRIVGGRVSARSPRNLLRTGLPDWMREHDPDTRVVTVSGKDRSAVIMAGRVPGDVYWYDDQVGAFVTSTYYHEALPDWVENYNRSALPPLMDRHCWESSVPADVAALSRRDTVDYEADGVRTFLPHCADNGVYRSPANWLLQTPFMDQASLGFARAAVEALGLGGRDGSDYLVVSLDATDRIGHRFGPYSREQLDNLLRLDVALGEFLAFLDDAVGRDRYIVALSSDHGVLPMPEYLQEQGLPGRRLTAEVNDALRDALAAVEARAGDSGGDGNETAESERRRLLAEELERYEFIEQAFTLEELAGDAPADSFTVLYRRSFHPDRRTTRLARFGVELRLSEEIRVGATQTTHGTPYLHDRRVPLIFYGAGIRPGVEDRRARTVDVAPTLARLLGVRAPGDLDGEALLR